MKKRSKEQVDILIIDNYDSFTFNLAQYLGSLGEIIQVYRNDKISLDDIRNLSPSRIVISPGPGSPKDAGISKDVINTFYKKIPILGVCLGHQCIGEVFGSRIINADEIVHGKTSTIHHDGRTIFKDVINPFQGARYHSLIIEKESVSPSFEITAYTDDGTIMGIRHKKYKLEGVQFHPESFLTKYGKKILENFTGL
ncbi:MAG: anthranilate synthase component II [Candidatus Humimicrobiaceae bacterium]